MQMAVNGQNVLFMVLVVNFHNKSNKNNSIRCEMINVLCLPAATKSQCSDVFSTSVAFL